MILAIDTSAAQCAAALLGAGVAITERRAMERGHAEHLFPLIDVALNRAGIGYKDVDRIAVCIGPGSFTGVRIGVAAARGIALGRGIPVIGISRFEALAAQIDEPVVVCLNGRGGSVYFQTFGMDGVSLSDPEMIDETGLSAAIAPGCTRFAGDAAHLLGACFGVRACAGFVADVVGQGNPERSAALALHLLKFHLEIVDLAVIPHGRGNSDGTNPVVGLSIRVGKVYFNAGCVFELFLDDFRQ